MVTPNISATNIEIVKANGCTSSKNTITGDPISGSRILITNSHIPNKKKDTTVSDK